MCALWIDVTAVAYDAEGGVGSNGTDCFAVFAVVPTPNAPFDLHEDPRREARLLVAFQQRVDLPFCRLDPVAETAGTFTLSHAVCLEKRRKSDEATNQTSRSVLLARSLVGNELAMDAALGVFSYHCSHHFNSHHHLHRHSARSLQQLQSLRGERSLF